MTLVLNSCLLACALAGVVAEIITIAVPERILGIADKDPDTILQGGFYRMVFVLSGMYLAGVVLMLVSGPQRFRAHGVVLCLLSVGVWLARKYLLRWRALAVAESTVCLIVLLDVVRNVARSLLP